MMNKGRFCSFRPCNLLQALLKWGLGAGGCLQLWRHQTIILLICVPVFLISSLFQIPRTSLFSQSSSGIALALRVVCVFAVRVTCPAQWAFLWRAQCHPGVHRFTCVTQIQAWPVHTVDPLLGMVVEWLWTSPNVLLIPVQKFLIRNYPSLLLEWNSGPEVKHIHIL